MNHSQTAIYFLKFFLCFLTLSKTFPPPHVIASGLYHPQSHCHDYQLKLPNSSLVRSNSYPVFNIQLKSSLLQEPSLQHSACSKLFPLNFQISNDTHHTLHSLYFDMLSKFSVHTFDHLVRLIRVEIATEVCQFNCILYESRNWGPSRGIKQMAQIHSFTVAGTYGVWVFAYLHVYMLSMVPCMYYILGVLL